MLILVTKQTVLLDVSRLCVERIAHAFQMAPGLIRVTWKTEGGTLKPEVDIEMPPILPPASLDVNDPSALAQWEAECADLPGIMEFLRAKDVGDPAKIIEHQVVLMVQELKVRMAAVVRSFQ